MLPRWALSSHATLTHLLPVFNPFKALTFTARSLLRSFPGLYWNDFTFIYHTLHTNTIICCLGLREAINQYQLSGYEAAPCRNCILQSSQSRLRPESSTRLHLYAESSKLFSSHRGLFHGSPKRNSSLKLGRKFSRLPTVHSTQDV